MTLISISTAREVVTLALVDSIRARELVDLLPLTLDLEDFRMTEKIAYLPVRLDASGAAEGATPAVGDLLYYVPWGNLALFYREASYSADLARLGRVTSSTGDIAALEGPITIARAD